MTEWDYPLHDLARYTRKCLHLYVTALLKRLNRRVLKTYRLIEDCARCEDCGRNVHDFTVPDKVWRQVYGSDGGILCYDCFADRCDRRFGVKWRMNIVDFGPIQ